MSKECNYVFFKENSQKFISECMSKMNCSKQSATNIFSALIKKCEKNHPNGKILVVKIKSNEIFLEIDYGKFMTTGTMYFRLNEDSSAYCSSMYPSGVLNQKSFIEKGWIDHG